MKKFSDMENGEEFCGTKLTQRHLFEEDGAGRNTACQGRRPGTLCHWSLSCHICKCQKQFFMWKYLRKFFERIFVSDYWSPWSVSAGFCEFWKRNWTKSSQSPEKSWTRFFHETSGFPRRFLFMLGIVANWITSGFCGRENMIMNKFKKVNGLIHDYVACSNKTKSMHRYAPVWNGINRCAPVCTGVHRYAPVCSGVHWYGPVWTGVHWCALVCTGMHWYMSRCGLT